MLKDAKTPDCNVWEVTYLADGKPVSRQIVASTYELAVSALYHKIGQQRQPIVKIELIGQVTVLVLEATNKLIY